LRFARALAVLAIAGCLSAVAAVPTKITYQGRLTSGGVAVNGIVNMTVKLYDHPTAGNLIWSETQSAAVVNGLYTVVLGNITPLNESILAVQLYLTVAVEGDPDLTPRTPLTSAPYAIRTKALDGTLGVTGGGTGATTLGLNSLLIGKGAGAVASLPNSDEGRLLASGLGNVSTPYWSALVASAAGLEMPSSQVMYIGGEQVVGARQPFVADYSNASGISLSAGAGQVVTVEEFNLLVVRFNLLLERLRAHGLIAP
jgi:hypothetical protein